MRKTPLFLSILLATALVSCKGGDEKKSEPAPSAKSKTTKSSADRVKPTIKIALHNKPLHIMAKSTIAAASGSKVAGTVDFMLMGDTLSVTAKITGLTPGEHGFHVHEKGDCSAADAKSAGGHFNPASVDHGDPKAASHHSGDLGNITANAQGVAELKVELPKSFISLDPSSANNIMGRAVVVHGGADDLKSQPSGAAGPRVGCGVIKVVTGGM